MFKGTRDSPSVRVILPLLPGLGRLYFTLGVLIAISPSQFPTRTSRLLMVAGCEDPFWTPSA